MSVTTSETRMLAAKRQVKLAEKHYKDGKITKAEKNYIMRAAPWDKSSAITEGSIFINGKQEHLRPGRAERVLVEILLGERSGDYLEQ